MYGVLYKQRYYDYDLIEKIAITIVPVPATYFDSASPKRVH